MIYLLWTAVLCGGGLALGALFDRELSETLAPTIFISVLSLYITGLFGFLKAGLWLVLLAGTAGGIFWLYKLLRSRGKEFFTRWFTPGVLVLLLAVLGIAWMQADKRVVGNDEFSHWARCVKVMYATDSLGVFHADQLMFPQYPPATALFQYLFVRLTPAFTESYLFRAFDLFALSLLLPVLAKFRWKDAGSALVAAAGLVLLPLVFYSDFYSNLQVDGMLALLQCYLLYTWFSRRKPDGFFFLQLVSGCSVLILTKESGFIMVLAALAIISWDALMAAKPQGKPALKKSGALLGASLLATLAFKFSWSAVVHSQGLVAGGTSDVGGRIAALFAPWPERFTLTLTKFLVNFFQGSPVESSVSLTMSCWLLIGFVALGLAARFSGCEALRRARIGLGLSFAVSCVGLLYLYFFQFSEYEGTRVMSMFRYISCWILPMLLLSAQMLLGAFADRKRRINVGPALLLALLLPFLPTTRNTITRFVAPSILIQQENEFRSAFFTPETFPFPLTEEDAVYFIADDTNVYEPLCAEYALYPYNADGSLGHNLNPDNAEFATWASDVSAEELADVLQKDYTYVYLYNVSSNFMVRYRSLFEDPSSIANRTLFRVNKNADSAFLTRCWPD